MHVRLILQVLKKSYIACHWMDLNRLNLYSSRLLITINMTSRPGPLTANIFISHTSALHRVMKSCGWHTPMENRNRWSSRHTGPAHRRMDHAWLMCQSFPLMVPMDFSSPMPMGLTHRLFLYLDLGG